MKKENNSLTLKWIYARSKKTLPLVILIAFLNSAVSVLLILLAKFSKDIINAGVEKVTSKIILCGVFLFASALLEIILNALISMLNVRANGKLVISLRNYMFSSVLHKKYPKVFDHHSGDLLNRFTSDIDQVVSGAVGLIPILCSIITKIIVGIGALLLENYIFALIVLLLGFLLPLLGRQISKKYKYLHKEVNRTEGKSRSFLQESFANIVVIKTFVSEAPILKKLNEYMKENLKLKLKRNLYSVIVTFCLSSFFTLGYYLVLIWGATQIALGAISYGVLYYYLQLISILRAPLQNVSGILPQYYAMLASAERLMDLENIEKENDPLLEDKLNALKSDFEQIEIKDVAFSYGGEDILKNSTLNIERNKITAITGESGSGKSTLFKLFLGLYEASEGSLTFNGTTPIDASTRAMFSYVPQGNMILSFSIKDNLTLCDNTITDEEIKKATVAADIYDFIMTLPDGFDTVLSERGAGLSEGQIQRISIARALLFDAPILLLDESTSALDEQTETTVLTNIKNMTDKTVIFITHRGTSISVCDSIIHVEDKKFVKIK